MSTQKASMISMIASHVLVNDCGRSGLDLNAGGRQEQHGFCFGRKSTRRGRPLVSFQFKAGNTRHGKGRTNATHGRQGGHARASGTDLAEWPQKSVAACSHGPEKVNTTPAHDSVRTRQSAGQGPARACQNHHPSCGPWSSSEDHTRRQDEDWARREDETGRWQGTAGCGADQAGQLAAKRGSSRLRSPRLKSPSWAAQSIQDNRQVGRLRLVRRPPSTGRRSPLRARRPVSRHRRPPSARNSVLPSSPTLI